MAESVDVNSTGMNGTDVKPQKTVLNHWDIEEC